MASRLPGKLLSAPQAGIPLRPGPLGSRRPGFGRLPAPLNRKQRRYIYRGDGAEALGDDGPTYGRAGSSTGMLADDDIGRLGREGQIDD